MPDRAPVHQGESMTQTGRLIVSSSPSFGRHTSAPVELLQSHGYEVRLLGRDEPDALREALQTAVAWIVGFEPVNAETLGHAPRIEVVAKSGAGMDNFDLAYLKERGIDTVSVPGGNARAVAEYTVSQMLALARGTLRNDAAVRDGAWKPSIGIGLDGRTLGIIGFGAIGRLLAPMAAAFGMRVVVYDPVVAPEDAQGTGVEAVSLDELIGTSDFISLHVPLTPGTHHLMNAERLRGMKSGSFLINNSRGGVVDESALVQFINDGHLTGAAIDVFEVEPLAPDHALRTVPNVILSAHTSGYSDTTLAFVTLTCAERVLQALKD